MLKALFALLSVATLSFSVVACVGQPVDDSEAELDQDDASEEEALGEAASALTLSDCCVNYDNLSSADKATCDTLVSPHCASNGSVQYCRWAPWRGGAIIMSCPNYTGQ